MNDTELEKIKDELQRSLEEGWGSFHDSNEFQIYSDFSRFILSSGFYESKWHNIIPNPAYDNAAKSIGEKFLQKSREFEIHFDTLFPGDFRNSKEFSIDNREARKFFLKAFYQKKQLCLFSLTFTHLHGKKFDFPTPPKLEIEQIY